MSHVCKILQVIYVSLIFSMEWNYLFQAQGPYSVSTYTIHIRLFIYNYINIQ